MVTNPSSSGFNADASQGASFYFADLIDEPLTLEDLEVFLAAERANAELWNSAAAENIFDTPPPPPSSGYPAGDFLGDPDPDPDPAFDQPPPEPDPKIMAQLEGAEYANIFGTMDNEQRGRYLAENS